MDPINIQVCGIKQRNGWFTFVVLLVTILKRTHFIEAIFVVHPRIPNNVIS